MAVITRFAPSPTGLFHAGSYRTALFSWIYARQNKGKFILRIEDTDKLRSKKEYEDNIIESLKWLGLTYDEFYRQSDRTEIYKKYIQKMIASGHAYISTKEQELKRAESITEKFGKSINLEKPEEISSVIRFKNPNKKVGFHDLIRGQVEFDTTELGDFVVAKSIDEPVFHLVVVIDDHEMKISHIIRGEDHISNTPRQILIYEAIGAQVPQYAHIPLLLSADRSKLSKRHGAIPVNEYRSRGYLPNAIVNYLVLLGWHPSDDQEMLNIDQIVEKFSLDRVQKSGAIFDEEKLKWFNRQYITKLSDADFAEHAKLFIPEWILPKGQVFDNLIKVLHDKISSFQEIQNLFKQNGELGFIQEVKQYSVENLLWKKEPNRLETSKHLVEVCTSLKLLPSDGFILDSTKQSIWNYVEKNGRGNVLWPLRVALTGQEKSPDPFICLSLLGKAESLKRIEKAIELLQAK